MKTSLFIPFMLILFLLFPQSGHGEFRNERAETQERKVPILLYHRFGSVAADGMTVTTGVFESQFNSLKAHGYTLIPLHQLVDYSLGKTESLPPHPVVITIDDGHQSVYTDFFPLLKKYQIPVTVFLYPSAISNASYAMTWNQLREMQATGLLDFQSHTFWHPNFKVEKKRLTSDEYEKFVEMQLIKSKERLEKELKVKVDMLAWPFGIYDGELIHQATKAGYVAAFSIERRSASRSDNPLAFPRYLITNSDRFSGYLF